MNAIKSAYAILEYTEKMRTGKEVKVCAVCGKPIIGSDAYKRTTCGKKECRLARNREVGREHARKIRGGLGKHVVINSEEDCIKYGCDFYKERTKKWEFTLCRKLCDGLPIKYSEESYEED